MKTSANAEKSTRERVLAAVRGCGSIYGMTAGEVSDASGVPRSTAARHLRLLRMDGLVVVEKIHTRRKGRPGWAYYPGRSE